MNTRTIKYAIISCLLLISASSFAQITGTHFFSDTTNGNLDYVFDYLEVEDGIILTGRQDYSNTVEPVMIKLDLSGELVWSTLSTFQLGTEANNAFYLEKMDDGYIYAVSHESFGWNNVEKTLWKVNPANGMIVWTHLHPSTDNDRIRMADYDSTMFITAAHVDGFSTILKMDKTNGDTLETVNFNSTGSSIDVAVDPNKNIYFSENNTVRKLNLDDFSQVIWKRTYEVDFNEQLYVHQMYIDHFGDLYLFGRDGGGWGHGAGIYIKVDVGTGQQIWMSEACYSDVRIIDFKDYNGKIYGTFRHTLVGGGVYRYRTSQVDKVTGNVDWISTESITPLGSPSTHSGGAETALSLDVDCDGDIYLTGYYGDANYGPEQWGIMKLNGNTGDATYDLTITQDSVNYDDYSVGLASCVFGNSPVFVGHEEDSSASYNVNPVYVTIDPANGDVVQRRRIGVGFQPKSRTLDIVNYNDSIYVFKQHGEQLILEQYDHIGNLLWSEAVTDTVHLFGGHMQVTGDYIYFTATRGIVDSVPPYAMQETDQIILARMDRNNGNVLDYETLSNSNSIVKMIELEADNNTAFFFYERNGNVYFNRWTPSSMSSDQLFQAAGVNINFGGKLNIVSDYDSPNYIILGTDAIYKIDKNTLAVTTAMSYTGNRNYYHILENQNVLYLSGSDASGTQVLTAVDKLTLSVAWEETYSTNGELIETIASGSNKLWITGTNNNVIEVHEVSALNGSTNWTYQTDPSTYGDTKPLDFALHPTRNYLTVSGSQVVSTGGGNVIIDNLDLGGTNIGTIVEEDEIGLVSQANTIAHLSDSSMWVGGALNRTTYGKEGFIYKIDYPTQSGLGIEETDVHRAIVAYPNPTNGKVTLEGLNQAYQVDVFNYLGMHVLSQQANGTSTIDLQTYDPGVYVVRVSAENYFQSLRIIKQ